MILDFLWWIFSIKMEFSKNATDQINSKYNIYFEGLTNLSKFECKPCLFLNSWKQRVENENIEN